MRRVRLTITLLFDGCSGFGASDVALDELLSVLFQVVEFAL